MSNTQQIELALSSVLKVVVIMFCTLVSAISLPMIASIMIAIIVDSVTFQGCVTTPAFWIISFLSFIGFGIYILDKIEKS
jgi:hypothetical protein